MAKQINWKPLDIKGLEDGDLGNKKYSLQYSSRQDKALQSAAGKKGGAAAKASGQFYEYCKSGGAVSGLIQGKKNVESGHLDSITPKSGSAEAIARNLHRQKLMKERGTHNSQKEYTCPTCNQIVKGSVTMKRFHGYEGEKCNLIKILNLIPEGTYKRSQVETLAEQYGYTKTEGYRIILNEEWFERIPIGSKKFHYKKL